MAWNTPRTWAAGEDPAASVYNTHIRDNFNAIGAAWTSYTPTWAAATTNPTLGNGTKSGAYIQAGKLVIFRIVIVGGSTTTWGSGVYTFSYPVAPLDNSTNGNPGINAFYWDAGVSDTKPFAGMGVGQSSTSFRVVMTSNDSYMSAVIPVVGTNARGAGDKINIAGTYEAA
jgi:hypothetical protein